MRLICFAVAISVGCVGCFEEPDVDATSTPTAGSSTAASTTTNSTLATETTDDVTSSSNGVSTTDGTLSGSGSNSSGSSTGTSTDGPETTGVVLPEPDFNDDFDRPDGAIDNNWVEKDQGVFSIENETARGNGTPSQPNPSFHDWFVYRDDPRQNIELITEFTVLSPGLRNEPFILARVQDSSLTLGPKGNYNGYMAVAGTEDPPGDKPENDQLCIIRFGASRSPLASWCNQQQGGRLITGFLYRLRLEVTGDGPVDLSATLERRDPSDDEGMWMPEAEVTHTDMDLEQITDAGVWGFGGGEGAGQISNYAYENFSANYVGL